MIITLLTIMSWPFILVGIAAVLWLLVLTADLEPHDYVGIPIVLILGAFFGFSLIFTDLYQYMAVISWKWYTCGVLSYIVIGVAYSFIKFYTKCRSRFNDYLKDKANFRPQFAYGENIDTVEQWVGLVQKSNVYVRGWPYRSSF